MTHPDGRGIGRLLAAVVPDLPARPDRLARIERGVRRGRLRRAGLAAGFAALVFAGMPAVLVAGPAGRDDPAPDAGNCPARGPDLPRGNGNLPTSAPGPLAPAGAVRAVLCRYQFDQSRLNTPPGPSRRLVLTHTVADLVTRLNELPVEEPIDPCFRGGVPAGYLTLEYRRGEPVTIEFGACGFVRRGAVTRHNGFEGIAAFDELYRRQELAAATPDAVKPADCVPRLTPGERGRFTPDPVDDVWLYAYVEGHRYLPAPLAVVTACRYVRAADGSLDRIRQVTSRTVTGQTAAAVEAISLNEAPSCPPNSTVRTVDVLLLRDAVGETVEIRAPRDTCLGMTFGLLGVTPNPALLGVLDRLLGPP